MSFDDISAQAERGWRQKESEKVSESVCRRLWAHAMMSDLKVDLRPAGLPMEDNKLIMILPATSMIVILWGSPPQITISPPQPPSLANFPFFEDLKKKIVSGGTWFIPCIYAINLQLPINQYIFKSVWLSEVKNVIYIFDSGH